MSINLTPAALTMPHFTFPGFAFDEKKHRYSYKGRTVPGVTTFLKQFEEPFDAPAVAARVALKRNVPVADVLAEWAAGRDYACEMGTLTHGGVEDYWRHVAGLTEYPLVPLAPGDRLDQDVAVRIARFKMLAFDRLKDFAPEAIEQRVFDVRWWIAGTLDALLRAANGKRWLADWKTNKQFRTPDDCEYDPWARRMLPPFADLWDCELVKYSIQLCLYWLVLERAGIEVEGAFLCWLPADSPARLFKVIDLRARVADYMESLVTETQEGGDAK